MALRGRYARLEEEQRGDGRDPARAADDAAASRLQPRRRVPYKAVALAVGLLLFGAVALVLGGLMQTGYIPQEIPHQARGFLVLGGLTFLPGFYHSRIAYYALRDPDAGYCFSQIPSWD